MDAEQMEPMDAPSTSRQPIAAPLLEPHPDIESDDDEDIVGQPRLAAPLGCLQWWRKQSERCHASRRMRPFDWLSVLLPCTAWLRTYKVKEYLLNDVAAGLSIAFMVIPQGMSYAMLAGLPAAFGLYGACMPVLAYAFFGSSPHLAIGPVAITSILLGSGLQDIIPEARDIRNPNFPGSPDLDAVQQRYNNAAIQVAFLVSLMYTAVGMCQLGFLANFLSHSVISGFTSGAAILIGLSQMKYCLGIQVPRAHTALEMIQELMRAIGGVEWHEAVMCAGWLTVLLAVKRAAKSSPRRAWLRPLGPIGVCLASIAVVRLLDLDGRGIVRTVQTIQRGMPRLTIGAWLPLTDAPRQAQLAAVIALVDFMESISVAKTLARKNRYRIHVTQEILGMGVANLFGSMFNAYTTTGSFCRSAVLSDAGARTGLAGAVTGVAVILVLTYLTPIFQIVPYNAMGAIVLSSVLGLFELEQAVFLFNASFRDFLVWVAAFGGTLTLGVQAGLVIAIALAILLVVSQSAFPHVALLGRLPGTGVYRSVDQYPSALLTRHVAVVRVDAPIYFANVQWVRTKINAFVADCDDNPALQPLYFCVLDMAPVSFVDANGLRALAELLDDLREQGVRLVLAELGERVRTQLAAVQLLQAVGPEWVFVTTCAAVDACTALAARGEGAALAPALEAFPHLLPSLNTSRDRVATISVDGWSRPASARHSRAPSGSSSFEFV